MNEEPPISMTCYLCEQPIEFPAELANQVTECPSCGQRIKLFTAQRDNGWSISRLGPFNKKQKFLTCVALFLLGVIFFNAPWEIKSQSGSGDTMTLRAQIVYAPVCDPPSPYGGYEPIGHQVLWG